MTRTRTAECPGCGHPQPLFAHRLIAHHTDGTPMPVTNPDYARMCPWSLTRPDAQRPASTAIVRTAQHATTATPAPRRKRSDPTAPTAVQTDLLDLLDTLPTNCTTPRGDVGA